MKPGHIVVLGGTGFVGSHLVPRLQRDGHRITVLSRNRDKRRELSVLPGVRVVNADVHDIEVIFAIEDDRVVSEQLGAKGVGEIGIVGVAAAVSNAIYHATGRRLHSAATGPLRPSNSSSRSASS